MSRIDWEGRGKTVSQLIEELLTFENQGIEVRISLDGGDTSVPISLVVKSNNKFAVLRNCQEIPTFINHRSDEN
jgi:hypothetical protein